MWLSNVDELSLIVKFYIMYNLIQLENRYKKRYIKNTRETSIETPGVKLYTVDI